MTCLPTDLIFRRRPAWLRRFLVLAALFALALRPAGAQPIDYEKDEALAAATVDVATERLSLAELFALCEQQTAFKFVFVKTDLPLAAEIRVTPARRVSLAALLGAAGVQAGVRFHRTNQQIAVRPGRAEKGSGALTGRVRDAGSRTYLSNATVALRDLNLQTATLSGGEYFFAEVPAGEHELVVSFMGYADVTRSIAASGAGITRADVDLGAEVLQLGAFVVAGEREGQARALQQKRAADNVMDIVSADSAGKLPDGNAAEAVRRLAGVFAEIDQNEGRFIVVRGIDASLNNITVNGVSVGSPDGGSRGVAMDAVPADLISRIEVVKAVTPDMDAQAIGASVNIVTPSAFDRDGAFAYGTLASGYYHGPKSEFKKNKFTPYSGSATAGTTFGDGKWGIVVGASYNYRHYISNRRSGGNPWYPAAPAGQPGADIFFPATQALFHYDVQRWRKGWNGALEFRPDANHQYFLRVTDNHFQDDEGRQQNGFDFFQTAYPASFTATSAHFSTGRSTVEYRRYLQRHAITNVSLGGKDLLAGGATQLDYTVAVGRAKIIVPDREDWEFRSASNAFPNDIDTSTLYWRVTPTPNFYDAASYPFRRVRFRKDDQTEENATAALNLKQRAAFLGRDGFWQIGAKYFTRDKQWNRDNVDYLAGTGANLFTLAQFGVSEPAPQLFGGYFRMSPQINLEAITKFFRENPQYFVLNPSGTLSDSNVNDFKMTEDIGAAYAMARANAGPVSALAGVRVERSTGDITQTELPTAGSTQLAPRFNHFKKSFTEVLPGVHLRYAPQRNWVFRAAWTNTLGRPNYADMAGAATFSYVETATGSGVYTGSLSSGNPDLKPYKSRNLDLTSEYYFSNAGIFSVSAFDKKIANPVFTNAYTLRNTSYQGLAFQSLSYSRPENATSGKIRGVEFNYQQQLTMLPRALSGFGFAVNFTTADSEERLFTRPNESLHFAKQAGKLYNVALFYEKFGVQARLAYTYTGAFVKSYGTDVNSDMYQAPRRIWDAKVSYRVSKNFTVFADIINLGEEPLDEYTGIYTHNGATESYWWTANFGVHWKL
jgi:TonB-dependent receptor